MIRNILKKSSNLNVLLKKYYHSHFDPKLNFFIELNSLKTIINNRTTKIYLDFERLNGTPMRLRFYDSHRNLPDLKSNESTLPTILVLPSGEFKIEDYNYLIGNLVKDQYRVIAIELPGMLICISKKILCELYLNDLFSKGFGESVLLKEDDFYDFSTIQKSHIIKNFLTLYVSNRKRLVFIKNILFYCKAVHPRIYSCKTSW